jgi:hypothetical protein
MIRGGFLSAEDRRQLIALARTDRPIIAKRDLIGTEAAITHPQRRSAS